MKTFLSLLDILWKSAFHWIYLSLSPLPFASLIFSAIFKASSGNNFAFSHLFFLRMVLMTTSHTMLWTCWEPVWGTPPMAKVMRKEAWHTQRNDQASGNPLFPSIYPQIRVLYGELSPITISLGEGVNLQLQVNKNSWAWPECFNLWTLKVLWPAWSGSSGCMWLLTASQLWEARDVLKLSKHRLFLRS